MTFQVIYRTLSAFKGIKLTFVVIVIHMLVICPLIKTLVTSMSRSPVTNVTSD